MPDTLLLPMIFVIIGGGVISLVIFILLAESYADDNTTYTEAITLGEVDSTEDLDDDNRLGFVRKRTRRCYTR